MATFARQVVGGRPVIQVMVGNQAEVIQELQGPIDRGHVDTAGGLLNGGRDGLGRGVVELADGLKHELPLRGHPVAPGPELLIPVAHVLCHSTSVVPPGPRGRHRAATPLALWLATCVTAVTRKYLALAGTSSVACEARGKEVVRQ